MNLANKISIGRIILIPFFITAVVYSKMDLALLFFVAAIVSDGVDGFVARALKQKTQLGSILDPIADKMLLISAYVCFSVVSSIPQHLRLPPYVPIIIISRDAIIILGSVIVYILKGDIKITPSIIGKVTTFFQMMTIVCILVRFDHSGLVWNIATALTILSGIDYVVKGSRMLGENHVIRRVG